MLTLFGSNAVSIMFRPYWLEQRSKWMVLVFAVGSGLTSIYSGFAGAYPITAIEALWAIAALQRFVKRHREHMLAAPEFTG